MGYWIFKVATMDTLQWPTAPSASSTSARSRNYYTQSSAYVGRNGGGYQRRLQLENWRSALMPCIPSNHQTLRASEDAYARDSRASPHVCARPYMLTAETKHEVRETRACSQKSNPRLNTYWFPNPVIKSTAAKIGLGLSRKFTPARPLHARTRCCLRENPCEQAHKGP